MKARRYYSLILWLFAMLWTTNIAGAQNNGTLVGSLTYGNTSNAGFGYYLNFAGGSNYITLPTAAFPFIQNQAFSVSMRVKGASGAFGNPGVFFGCNGGGATFWVGCQSHTTRVTYSASTGAFSGSVVIDDGNWHTVQVIYNGSTTMSIYVDGTLDSSNASTYNATTAAGAVQIGALGGSFEPSSGVIDELAIFNAAITPSAFSAPFANTASNLVSLYHFEQNLTDSTSHAPTTPGTPTLTITGGTGTYLTVTSTGSSGGTGTLTYQWYGDTSTTPTTLLTGQTGLTLTHHRLTPGTSYYYKLTVTDTASNTATSAIAGPFTTSAAAATVLKLGIIGDSLAAVTEGGYEPSPSVAADTLEQLYGTDARTVLVTNQGHGGATSAMWNAADTTTETTSGNVLTNYLNTALAAFQSAGCTWVHVMLGTNDAKNTVATTQAAYKANLQSIISACRALGMKVILSYSPYADYVTAGSPWDTNSNPLLKQYQVAINQLIDNRTVFLGSDSLWQFFSTHTSEMAGSDLAGIHPTVTGLSDTGLLLAQGIYRAVYATPWISLPGIFNSLP